MTNQRPEVCVGAVVRNDEQLLLIKRGNPPQAGRWSLPGGRVERGETLHQAVQREVVEETGIEITIVRFIDVVERVGNDHHFVIMDYLAEPAQRYSEPLAATDAADARWVHRTELESLDLTDGLLAFLTAHNLLD